MSRIDLVGVGEIAEIAEVTKQAVSNWRDRYSDFPKPLQELRTGPVWDKEQVLRWIKRHKGDRTEILCFINLKGGVGKTTLCVAIAEMLAQEKKKHVLVIDLDPQTNATVTLIPEAKWAERDAAGQTVAQLFDDRLHPEREPVFDIEKAIIPGVSTIKGGIARLDLLPSSIRLIEIQERIPLVALTGNFAASPLDILKNAIAPIIDRYDYILVDCPPSLGTVTKNGLRIATGYVVPTIPDIVSTWGVYQIAETVRRFGADTGHVVPALGIVASKVRGNDLHRRIVQNLKEGHLRRSAAPNAEEEGLPPLFATLINEAVTIARSANTEAPVNTLRQKYGEEFHALAALAAEIEEKCQN